MTAAESWKCYAMPAGKGRECGHLNVSGGLKGPSIMGKRVLCCEECGCTKISSDARFAKRKRT